MRDSFHQAPVANTCPGAMVDDLKSFTIEFICEELFR